ncbi:unnamed protein product [Paramecium octaurelia]|uniref:CCHC-type domain-containing protein n=1 Tax=Paramecium octaurelia TaxID=43137 RepID=A0A8S1UIS0_PAROT|nr:unnamed protein product [Paramecium octaurelia]
MSIWQNKCTLDYHIQQQIKLDALEELWQEYKKQEIRISKQKQKYEQKKKYNNKKKRKKSSSSSSSSRSSSSSSSTSSSFQAITSSSESDSLLSLPSNSKSKNKQMKSQTKILDFIFDINPPKRDYLIEYELNGQKKMTSMKNLNEKIQKLKSQSQSIQNYDDKNDDDNLKQDLKDELELGANRYYQQNPFEYCYRCKQTGHQERQCTEQLNIQCNYCLSQKHVGDICSNVSCFRCNQMGHRKYDCKFQQRLQQCINCGKNTHKEQDCGVLTYNIQIFLDQIECLVCRNYGHINCLNIIS